MSMDRTSTPFPSSTPQWKYDVFLSFRDDDTRKGFTDHLYTALERHGIIAFKDDLELQKGKAISPEIFTAIEESRFALIVLSENYASSTWCLDELLKILECMEARQTVLPIFYEVDPSAVRKQTGSFAETFTKHDEKLRDDAEKVRRWKDALKKVANFSGWVSKDRSESRLVRDIVEVVWKKLRPTFINHVGDLVGIDSRLNQIKLLLDARVDDVCFIGIWGMGGIGKTTIAREVYKRISHDYEFGIFLPGVRNIFEKYGLRHLQKQLLYKIGLEKDDIWDVTQGVTLIRRFLSRKRVLLILDDVNHLDQLEYLAGNPKWFGFGSRVLITTRYERLLINHGVERRFEVEGLNDNEALQLFSWKAFKKDYPEPSYVDLSNQVVDYAKGLPLVVKVLGSFLHGRDLSAWKSALDKLREVCNSDILETLRINYDGLEYYEQKIFLDIACFFNGKDKDRVRETLDSCGFYADIGIDVLVERSLLTIDSCGYLLMHDLLQEMGREIVRRESVDEPGRRSRLWLCKDVDHVLSQNTGTETMEGIMVHRDEPGKEHHKQGVVHANAKSFSRMKKLRYLKLKNVNLSDELEYLPNSLRFLEWPQFPLKSFPSSFNPEALLELKMRHSRFEHIKPIYSLRIIELSHSLSLVKTPDFSGIPFLEQLILEGCIRLSEVDPSVVVLERLTVMNLKDCKSLVRLPSRVSGLKSLKVLNVSGCSKLEKLPEDLGHVECLEELDVSGTAVREPPSSIGRLKNLTELSLRGCKGPSSNPWSIMLFPFRSLLKTSSNPAANLWLPCLSGLPSLTELNLSYCNLLDGAIPNDLDCLSSLVILDLSGNQFVSLPSSICQLSRLYMLEVRHCPKLQTLPELSYGRHDVRASHCDSLETSGRDMIRLFANCFKRVEKQCCMISSTSAEFTSSRCEFVVPGNEIPEWFSHISSVGSNSSVSVDLHPGWFTNKLMGYAWSVVFEVQGQPSGDCDYIICKLSAYGKDVGALSFLNFAFNTVQDHLWLYYIPHAELNFDEWQNIYTRLEFSFPAKTSGVLKVKKCGVHVVYEEDVEAVLQRAYPRQAKSSVSICEEVSEFPDTDLEKAAAAAVSSASVSESESESESGGIAKRRRRQRRDHGAGPSQTENGCIDEEPDPKRSKQH